MIDDEIDFGPDLMHPTEYLKGAIALYGAAFVAECFAVAMPRPAGAAILRCDTHGLEFVERAGEHGRDCPRCVGLYGYSLPDTLALLPVREQS